MKKKWKKYGAMMMTVFMTLTSSLGSAPQNVFAERVTNRKMVASTMRIDDFEDYGDKIVGNIWERDGYGDAIEMSTATGESHSTALSYKYIIGDRGYTGAIHSNLDLDLSQYKGISLWLKQDGSGNSFTVQFKSGEDVWEAKIDAMSNTSGVVEFPFDTFRAPGWHSGNYGTAGKDKITQIGFFINGSGNGKVYIDDVEGYGGPEIEEEEPSVPSESVSEPSKEEEAPSTVTSDPSKEESMPSGVASEPSKEESMSSGVASEPSKEGGNASAAPGKPSTVISIPSVEPGVPSTTTSVPSKRPSDEVSASSAVSDKPSKEEKVPSAEVSEPKQEPSRAVSKPESHPSQIPSRSFSEPDTTSIPSVDGSHTSEGKGSTSVSEVSSVSNPSGVGSVPSAQVSTPQENDEKNIVIDAITSADGWSISKGNGYTTVPELTYDSLNQALKVSLSYPKEQEATAVLGRQWKEEWSLQAKKYLGIQLTYPAEMDGQITAEIAGERKKDAEEKTIFDRKCETYGKIKNTDGSYSVWFCADIHDISETSRLNELELSLTGEKAGVSGNIYIREVTLFGKEPGSATGGGVIMPSQKISEPAIPSGNGSDPKNEGGSEADQNQGSTDTSGTKPTGSGSQGTGIISIPSGNRVSTPSEDPVASQPESGSKPESGSSKPSEGEAENMPIVLGVDGITLKIGETRSVKVFVNEKDVTDEAEFIPEKDGIVKIGAQNIIEAIHEGKTDIQVQYKGAVTKLEAVVLEKSEEDPDADGSDITVTGIRLLPEILTLVKGESATLGILAQMSDGSERLIKNSDASFQTKNTSIISVDADGIVKGQKVGNNTFITVSYKGFQETCVVQVLEKENGGQQTSEPVNTELKLSKETLEMQAGQSVMVSATAQPDTQIEWQAGSSEVQVTPSADGKSANIQVSEKAAGSEIFVLVMAGNAKKKITIKITGGTENPVDPTESKTTLTLDKKSVVLNLKKKTTVNATVVSKTVSKNDIKLTTSNRKVATAVNTKGKLAIQAKGAGVAYITVSVKGADSQKIKVTVRPENVQGLRTTSVKKTSVRLAWKKSSAIVGYQIRCNGKIRTTKKNSIVLSGLKANKRYKVTIRTYRKTTDGTAYGNVMYFIVKTKK